MKFYVDVQPPRYPLERYWMLCRGIQNIGGEVIDKFESSDEIYDVDWFVTWNNVKGFPANRTIVCENPYLSDSANRPYLAMSVGGHNGAGKVPELGPERWERMEVKLKPQRSRGDWILLIEQRGIGGPGMAMPPKWPKFADELHQATGKHVEIRKPPSRRSGQAPLEEVFDKAAVVVIWTSNCGTLALVEGLPVYLCGPHHICEAAMNRFEYLVQGRCIGDMKLTIGDRQTAFERLANAQFTHDEIESGYAFEQLIKAGEQQYV